jgi:ankyrin repeat protein
MVDDLHEAARDGDLGVVTSLIESGADINARAGSGYTPLHLAAQEYRPAVVAALLDQGAEIDATDKHGNTPLWTAVFNSRGRGDVIRLLLARGADARHVNHHGATPIGLAQEIANFDVRQYFPPDPLLQG